MYCWFLKENNYYSIMKRIPENLQKLHEDFLQLQELGRSEDLAEWNRTQYGLWLKLVKKNLVDLEDLRMFTKFAAFFYDFFQNNNRIPTINEVKRILLGKRYENNNNL